MGPNSSTLFSLGHPPSLRIAETADQAAFGSRRKFVEMTPILLGKTARMVEAPFIRQIKHVGPGTFCENI